MGLKNPTCLDDRCITQPIHSANELISSLVNSIGLNLFLPQFYENKVECPSFWAWHLLQKQILFFTPDFYIPQAPHMTATYRAIASNTCPRLMTSSSFVDDECFLLLLQPLCPDHVFLSSSSILRCIQVIPIKKSGFLPNAWCRRYDWRSCWKLGWSHWLDF